MNDRPNPTEVSTTPAPLWAWLTATFFGAGKGRPGPGTWGSAAALLVWAGLAYFLPENYELAAIIALAAIAVIAGIPAATMESRACGGKDPSHVVIDEVAGQLITVIGAPVRFWPLFAGFILFRAFDILKPPPVRQLEKLPEGTGIMMDDVAAGILGLIVLQLLLHFGIVR